MSDASITNEETAKSERETFVHHIAVKLSRSLNTLNPNDGLANTVINFAKNNTQDLPKFKTCKFDLLV